MKNWETLEPDVYKLLGSHRHTKGRGGNKIKYLVIHHNAGINSVESVWQLWQYSRAASAHYQIETSGRIGQLVNDYDTAYHAANWKVNQESIGIEFSNSGGPSANWPIAPATREEGAHLIAALCVFYKLGRPKWGKNMFPHHKFTSTSCPGRLGPSGDYGKAVEARAQQWYDIMTGKQAPKPATGAATMSSVMVHPMGNDPTKYRVSSGFGPRKGGFHRGIDFAAPLGTPIYAAADGFVVEGKERRAGSVTGFGNWAWLDCQASVGADFIYGHMRHHEIYVRKGDKVKAGQLIARVGNEGQSTGPHCHFERWTSPGRVGGKAIDPAPSLAKLGRAKTSPKLDTGGLTMSEKQEIINEIRAAEKRIKDFVATYVSTFNGPIGSDVKDIRQQLAGGRDRGQYPGWDQLGDRTAVDGIAAVGAYLGVPGYKDTLGKVTGPKHSKETNHD